MAERRHFVNERGHDFVASVPATHLKPVEESVEAFTTIDGQSRTGN